MQDDQDSHVQLLMDACAVALGGALPLHHIRSCPSLLQPIQDELDKVTCGDLGVDASDSDVSASMVEVYRGRSFGVTVLSLPAGASLPMQDLQDMLMIYKVLKGEVKKSVYRREQNSLPLKRKSRRWGREYSEAQVSPQGEEEVLTPSSSSSASADEDHLLLFTAKTAATMVQILASFTGAHHRPKLFVLETREEAAVNREEEAAPRDRKQVLKEVQSLGSARRRYEGKPWGPVAIGTRMEHSSRTRSEEEEEENEEGMASAQEGVKA